MQLLLCFRIFISSDNYKIERKVKLQLDYSMYKRYLFGEIMYGGHITDDWDRRLCVSYLEELMQPELVDGELQLAPGKDPIIGTSCPRLKFLTRKVINESNITKVSQHRQIRI